MRCGRMWKVWVHRAARIERVACFYCSALLKLIHLVVAEGAQCFDFDIIAPRCCLGRPTGLVFVVSDVTTRELMGTDSCMLLLSVIDAM